MTMYERNPIIATLTDDQITELEAAFSLFDQGGCGHVSTSDFRQILRLLGKTPSEEELQLALEEFDSTGTGRISREQFLEAMTVKIKESECKEQVIQLFKEFDDDGNGSISVDELRQVMYGLVDRLTNEEVEGMVKQADKQGTGEITFHDFIKLISRHGR